MLFLLCVCVHMFLMLMMAASFGSMTCMLTPFLIFLFLNNNCFFLYRAPVFHIS